MSDDKSGPGAKALKWWQDLQPKTDKAGKVTSRGDPGGLARLRRAASPIDALSEARAISLARRFGVTLENRQRLARIGALAHVLAHVKTHDHSKHMAQMLGPDAKGDNAVMSSLRFQRLMAAREPADLMREMRSAVKLLKGAAKINNLGEAFYYWNDRTRLTWTYNYWSAGDAGPASGNNQTGADSSSNPSGASTNTTANQSKEATS